MPSLVKWLGAAARKIKAKSHPAEQWEHVLESVHALSLRGRLR
jgi:hypothetical protein